MIGIWIILALEFGLLQLCVTERVHCYTCSVDFRSVPFSMNDTCMFPKNDSTDRHNRVECSEASTHCKAVVTRVSGILAQLVRSCDTGCEKTCAEKGYGIAFSDCTYCCDRDPACGLEALVKSGDSAIFSCKIGASRTVILGLSASYTYFIWRILS